MFPLRATAAAIPAGTHVDAAVDSPALGSFPPPPRAGEIVLTQGQKLALLVMRQSDLSKAVLAGVIAQTNEGPAGRDFYSCARLGLAINKGRFHVLTPQGRWRADRVAEDVARQYGLHIISYDHGNTAFGLAAQARCTCHWRGMRRSRYIKSWLILISQDAARHLEQVAEKEAKAS